MSDQLKHKVYLGLGSNLGNRKQHIHRAMDMMNETGITILKKSAFYKSPAWGFESSNAFYNLCISATTNHDPEQLIKVLKDIEIRLGREKSRVHYTDRIIDLDILFFDDLIMNSAELTIPHPHIQDRRFVLKPLAEINPDLKHPVVSKTIKELLQLCKDESRVDRVAE